MTKLLAVVGSVVVRVLLAVPALFAFCALLAPGGTLSTLLAGAFGLAVLAFLVLARPLWKAAAATLALVAVVLVWFAMQEPRNDREWQVDVSRLPRIERDGDRVTIRDLRDFEWTGADAANPRWTERTYDLSKLREAALVLSYWDGNTSICHTMFSFGFEDGERLALSVETRKEVGEEYSTWRGFFRQFELFYVLATERDAIGVRVLHRSEDVYLYPLQADPVTRRRLIEDVLATAADLSREPRWYGALRANCTTTLQGHVDAALGRPQEFRWDTALNGRIDEVAWRAGAIAGEGPFEQVRAAHRVTDVVKRIAGRPDFSQALHAALPAR